jgi:cysteine desulfurase family protein
MTPHHKEKIYLNNAATSWPKAPGVLEAVAANITDIPEHPGRTASYEQKKPDSCRRLLASLIGVENQSRIVLTQNATHALNLAILGLGLQNGCEVVTSAAEHNSMLRPFAHLEHAGRVHLSIIGITPNGILKEDEYEKALERSPRLVALNHASNVTGSVLPVARLFTKAKNAGAVTLLDASQSLGHVPVDIKELNADMIAFTGHKGLRGPAGTGGLYVSEGLNLEQIIVGGTGVRSDLRLHPDEMPTRLEAGTQNMPALAGLEAALKWREDSGNAFHANASARTLQLRNGLSGISSVKLYGDNEGSAASCIVSFTIPGWSVEEAGFVFSESFGIICRTGLHCAPLIHDIIGSAPEGTIRFSPSGATGEQEIIDAISAVRKMAS